MNMKFCILSPLIKTAQVLDFKRMGTIQSKWHSFFDILELVNIHGADTYKNEKVKEEQKEETKSTTGVRKVKKRIEIVQGLRLIMYATVCIQNLTRLRYTSTTNTCTPLMDFLPTYFLIATISSESRLKWRDFWTAKVMNMRNDLMWLLMHLAPNIFS